MGNLFGIMSLDMILHHHQNIENAYIGCKFDWLFSFFFFQFVNIFWIIQSFHCLSFYILSVETKEGNDEEGRERERGRKKDKDILWINNTSLGIYNFEFFKLNNLKSPIGIKFADYFKKFSAV